MLIGDVTVAVLSLSSNCSTGISAMKRRGTRSEGNPAPPCGKTVQSLPLREDRPVDDRYESTRAWLNSGPLICLSDRTLSLQRYVIVGLNSRVRHSKYLLTMYTLHEKLTFDATGLTRFRQLAKEFAFSS